MAKKVNTKANEEVKEEEVDVDIIDEDFEETTEAEEETETQEKVKTKKPGFFKTKILPKAEKALEIVGGIALVMGIAYGIKVAISAGADEEDYETEETDETDDNVIPFPQQEETEAA